MRFKSIKIELTGTKYQEAAVGLSVERFVISFFTSFHDIHSLGKCLERLKHEIYALCIVEYSWHSDQADHKKITKNTVTKCINDRARFLQHETKSP